MTTALQNIPTFVLEHKWSSDIESNVYSDLDSCYDRVNLNENSKPNKSLVFDLIPNKPKAKSENI